MLRSRLRLNRAQARLRLSRYLTLSAVSVFSLGLVSAQQLPATPPQNDSPAIEARVNSMLAKMSLEDKLTLLGGQDIFYTRPIPSIGLRRFTLTDGPVGVRLFGPTTAYTASIALAATWDENLARRVGASLGDDARARGADFLLGPGVNIYRSPVNGRNMEYFGEDPFLASRMAVNYIEGVQDRGVIATVKHFAANNSEFDRHNINSVVDERTLHELYLPAFEAAVKEAHVGAVMDSYNLLNGEHLTQNRTMNVDLLKNEWGFDGILMSDWDATYDGVAAANGGLDLEMPSPKFMSVKTLTAAVQAGTVAEATIDDKVRRILRTTIRFGLLDRQQTEPQIPLLNPAAGALALDESLESVTLLKNQNSLLPLSLGHVKTIAVVGPDAFPAVPGGGGSSRSIPFVASSFLTGLVDYCGTRTNVVYIYTPNSLEQLAQETPFQDVTLQTYNTDEATGTPVGTKSFDRIDQWRDDEPAHTSSPSHHTYLWKATFAPTVTGDHLLAAIADSRDTYTVRVAGRKVLVQAPRSRHANALYITLPLTAGRNTTVEVELESDLAAPRLAVGLKAIADMLSPESKQTIAAADAVLVSVGFDYESEAEGYDRTFDLPWGQNELIRTVASLNPHTIVNLTAGGAVDTTAWLDRVPVLLHNWYSGQAGGKALAEILFGERNPEGHLPMSWERRAEDNPTFDHYQEEPGLGRKVTYAEGLNVGYRFYTTAGKTPLFPFGFGLSYTSFTFEHLKVDPGKTPSVYATVSFDVHNIGHRAGAEVAQLYIGDPSATVQRPAKELKAFQKVRLQPGETRHIVFSLDRRAFAWYDVKTHGWRVDAGKFQFFVGDSSASTPLQSDLEIRRPLAD